MIKPDFIIVRENIGSNYLKYKFWCLLGISKTEELSTIYHSDVGRVCYRIKEKFKFLWSEKYRYVGPNIIFKTEEIATIYLKEYAKSCKLDHVVSEFHWNELKDV